MTAVAMVAIPAAANADVTPGVTGTQLTLTGDGDAHTIALADNDAGLLTHNSPVVGWPTAPTSIQTRTP